MSDPRMDTTRGLIDLIGAVSHDEDKADWYDVFEYIDTIPRLDSVLKDLAQWLHSECL